jgi:hypothetical protein
MLQTARYLAIRVWLTMLRLAQCPPTNKSQDSSPTVQQQVFGQYKQQGSLDSRKNSVSQPEIASQTSERAALSTKRIYTMVSILTVVSAVEAAFEAAEAVEKEFEILKPYITQFMNTAETAYASSTTAGSSKFAAVMASVKAVAGALGLSWSSGLETTIQSFINVAKAAFNAFAAVVTAVAPNSAGGVASAVSAVSSAAEVASSTLTTLSSLSAATSSAA